MTVQPIVIENEYFEGCATLVYEGNTVRLFSANGYEITNKDVVKAVTQADLKSILADLES